MDSLATHGDTILRLSEFVKQLDESIRLEAFRFLLEQEFKTDGESTRSVARALLRREPQDRAVAPQELIRRSGVSTFTDKAVVLAYWLEEFQQKVTFSSAELKSAFEQAREQSPKNPSDLVAKMEASARIMKADKTGSIQQYRLTSTAIQDVERWLRDKGT
jgi:hypothetical protein